MEEPLEFLKTYLPSIFGLVSSHPLHPRDLEKLRLTYKARKELFIEATLKRGGHVAEGIVFDLWVERSQRQSRFEGAP
jgi:hypothetical protein